MEILVSVTANTTTTHHIHTPPSERNHAPLLMIVPTIPVMATTRGAKLCVPFTTEILASATVNIIITIIRHIHTAF
jgi:hypothetical protein